MNRNLYYVGIAFFGMVNGVFNPFYILAFAFSWQLMAAPFFGNVELVAFFASLMLSTATLILAGIPAAIYERYVGAKNDSTDISLWIWLAGAAILAMPAVGNFLRIGL